MKYFCTFSEAIREGAKLRPQAGQLFKRLPSGEVGSCAIGAGYEAITGDVDLRRSTSIYSAIVKLYPYIDTDEVFECHVRGCEEPALFGLSEMILHLNDDHLWTREQIADWLESEEEKLGFITLIESVEVRSESPELTEVTA